MDAFMEHPAVQKFLAGELQQRCCKHILASFEGQVPSELEAMFCRGAEWDSGVEHLFLLQVCHLRAHIKHIQYPSQMYLHPGGLMSAAHVTAHIPDRRVVVYCGNTSSFCIY
jgi:hypothetical protein